MYPYSIPNQNLSAQQNEEKNKNTFSSLMNGYIYENPKSGYLTFQVSSGAIPIPNAKLTVSKNIGDNMYIGKTLLTDINGKTSEIPLPAPDKSLSLSPGSYKPYSTYDISVSADGYLTEYFYDVPVFEDITSLQPVSLKPDVGAVNIEYDNPVNERSFNNL